MSNGNKESANQEKLGLKEIRMQRANTITQVRAEALNHSARGLLIINGGGAIAVATWLQAVWDEPWATPMLSAQVFGAQWLIFGCLAAAVCPFLRYASGMHKNALTPFKNPVWWAHASATALSALFFLIGMLCVLHGARLALPVTSAASGCGACY